MFSRYAHYIAGIVIIFAFGVGGLILIMKPEEGPKAAPTVPVIREPEVEAPTTAPVRVEVIGSSVDGRVIERYAFGDGPTHVLFVGGIHGGYELNSVVLAYTLIDYLRENPARVPQELTVSIIPSLNPDGVHVVTGKEGRPDLTQVPPGTNTAPGRFNARGVDLNRNFACKWQQESMWRGTKVSAGTAAFSEPESVALKTLIEKERPSSVIFWHSKANAVYASECMDGILPGTRTLMSTYANAASYPAVDTFDAYPVTGDAEGWLASIGIPAITVELSTHETTEWERNLKGITAVLSSYSIAR